MEVIISGGKKPREVRTEYSSRALHLYERDRWSEKSQEESSWGILQENEGGTTTRSINEVKPLIQWAVGLCCIRQLAWQWYFSKQVRVYLHTCSNIHTVVQLHTDPSTQLQRGHTVLQFAFWSSIWSNFVSVLLQQETTAVVAESDRIDCLILLYVYIPFSNSFAENI